METKTILREEFEKSTGKKPTNVAGRLTDKYAKWLEKHTSVHSLVSLSIPVPEERDDRAQRPMSDEMKSACRKFWSEANIESPALTKSAAFELGFIEGYGFCEEFSAQENKDLLHQLGNCESAYKQERKLRESFEKALEERDQENKDLHKEIELNRIDLAKRGDEVLNKHQLLVDVESRLEKLKKDNKALEENANCAIGKLADSVNVWKDKAT